MSDFTSALPVPTAYEVVHDALLDWLEEDSGDFPGPAEPCEPTGRLPGPGKVEELAGRAELRQELFSDLDARWVDYDRLGLLLEPRYDLSEGGNAKMDPSAVVEQTARGGQVREAVPVYVRERTAVA